MKMYYALPALLFANLMLGQPIYEVPLEFLNNKAFIRNNMTSDVQNYEGSPYLYKDFASGRILTSEKDYPCMLRYNAYADVFEINTGKEDNIEVMKSKQIRVKVGDDEWELRQIPGGEQFYLQKLVDGNNFKVWVRNTAKFTEAEKAKTAYAKDKPAKFTLSKDYYIDKGQGLEPNKMRKKDLQELFRDKEDVMNAYIKQQGLSYKNEEDLVKMLQHFNNL